MRLFQFSLVGNLATASCFLPVPSSQQGGLSRFGLHNDALAGRTSGSWDALRSGVLAARFPGPGNPASPNAHTSCSTMLRP